MAKCARCTFYDDMEAGKNRGMGAYSASDHEGSEMGSQSRHDGICAKYSRLTVTSEILRR